MNPNLSIQFPLVFLKHNGFIEHKALVYIELCISSNMHPKNTVLHYNTVEIYHNWKKLMLIGKSGLASDSFSFNVKILNIRYYNKLSRLIDS